MSKSLRLLALIALIAAVLLSGPFAAPAAAQGPKFPPCPPADGAAATEPPLPTETPRPTSASTAAATQEAVFAPGYLGIAGESVGGCGTKVIEVRPDSPADKGGLKVDDVIVALNGKEMRGLNWLRSTVLKLAPGTEITLTVKRGEEELEIKVTLGERPAVTPPTAAPTKEATPEATKESRPQATLEGTPGR